MMKTSTKLIATGAASVLGVALAGGAYAATGSLTTADAPGQVLQVSGVGPAAGHASATAKAHANANAKGLFGAPAAHATPAMAGGALASSAASMAARHSTVGQVARPAPQMLPAYHAVMPTMRASMPPTVPQPMPRTATGMNGPTGSMR